MFNIIIKLVKMPSDDTLILRRQQYYMNCMKLIVTLMFCFKQFAGTQKS